MSPDDPPEPPPDTLEEMPVIQCDACRSAHDSPGRDSMAFFLMDTLTVPLVGCDDHLEQFRSVCSHTSRASASLVKHRPAGGIVCPGCRLAPNNPHQPMIPIGDGFIGVLACSTHGSEVIDRFQAGLETKRQLASSVRTR